MELRGHGASSRFRFIEQRRWVTKTLKGAVSFLQKAEEVRTNFLSVCMFTSVSICSISDFGRSPAETNPLPPHLGSATQTLPLPRQLQCPHLGGQAVPKQHSFLGQEVPVTGTRRRRGASSVARCSARQPQRSQRPAADRRRGEHPHQAPRRVTAGGGGGDFPAPARARRTHAHCAQHEGRRSDQVTRRGSRLPIPPPASHPPLPLNCSRRRRLRQRGEVSPRTACRGPAAPPGHRKRRSFRAVARPLPRSWPALLQPPSPFL